MSNQNNYINDKYSEYIDYINNDDDNYDDYNNSYHILFIIVILFVLLYLAFINPTWGLITFIILWTLGFIRIDKLVSSKNKKID